MLSCKYPKKMVLPVFVIVLLVCGVQSISYAQSPVTTEYTFSAVQHGAPELGWFDVRIEGIIHAHENVSEVELKVRINGEILPDAYTYIDSLSAGESRAFVLEGLWKGGEISTYAVQSSGRRGHWAIAKPEPDPEPELPESEPEPDPEPELPEPEPEEYAVPTTLEVVSGDGQSASVSQQLPLVVRVLDQNGNPMSGVTVSFSVTPDGKANPSITPTNVNGQAQTKLTFGSGTGTYTVTVSAKSIAHSVTLDSVTFTVTAQESELGQIVFSEIMFETAGGLHSLPQWVELYNTTDKDINVSGWQLEWYRREPKLLDVTTTFETDFVIPAKQSRLVVSRNTYRSRQNSLRWFYDLFFRHSTVLDQNDGQNRDRLIARGGFYLKLFDGRDTLIDQIGTVADNASEPTWELPDCVIDGVRSSLIRRFDDGTARNGMERAGWIRAWDTKTKPTGRWYGRASDVGTPAYRSDNTPLPVTLSIFRAEQTNAGVVLNWTTESEVDNAGFYIYRSQSKDGEFEVVNPKMIQGAGTTGERTEYTWTDTTAKPNTVYYYRIEDVSHAGERKQLTTVRMRGLVSARGKLATSWGSVKMKK
ncbi:MAG: lamin tail domain-containing protein [Candidatus Poribacteria bacterium]|nr:lamin tail domain-containing protein [Candidatus Poribacteria bacterium]